MTQAQKLMDKMNQSTGEVKAPVKKEMPKTIAGMLNDDRFKQQLVAALPTHMKADRVARIALTSIRNNPSLQKANPLSLFGAIVKSSQLGLEIDSGLGHAYLVPYGKEVNLIVGYRGLVDLARRSGNITSITAQVVYSNDEFEYEYGLDEKLKHKPVLGDRGNPIYYYAIARLKDGGHQFEVMSKEDVEKIKLRSKAANSKSSPWHSDYDEMAKKTVVRRLAKMLPLSVEMQKATVMDEYTDANIEQNNEQVFDVEITGEPVEDFDAIENFDKVGE